MINFLWYVEYLSHNDNDWSQYILIFHNKVCFPFLVILIFFLNRGWLFVVGYSGSTVLFPGNYFYCVTLTDEFEWLVDDLEFLNKEELLLVPYGERWICFVAVAFYQWVLQLFLCLFSLALWNFLWSLTLSSINTYLTFILNLNLTK